MKTKTDTVAFYSTFYTSAVEAGFDTAERGVYFDGLLSYAFTGREPEFVNPVMRALFLVCKEQIDANIRKYKNAVQAGKNGRKGGAPKGNKNARKRVVNQSGIAIEEGNKTTGKTTGETTLNDNDTENDNLNDTVFYEKEKKAEEDFQEDLETRRNRFFESIKPYVEYWGRENMQRFYEYWSEKTKDGQYMRFELEDFWELPNRIALWINKTAKP